MNVRQLLLMIEESIDEGSQWVVLEPNDAPNDRHGSRRLRNVAAPPQTLEALVRDELRQ